MSKITLSFMQRFTSNLDNAIRSFVSSITGDLDSLETADKTDLVSAINEANRNGGSASNISELTDVELSDLSNGEVLKYNATSKKWVNTQSGAITTLKSATLSAGNTSVTFTNLPTTGNYMFDIYTTVAGLDYESITSGSGTLTVTYEAQSSDVTVYLKIEEY